MFVSDGLVLVRTVILLCFTLCYDSAITQIESIRFVCMLCVYICVCYVCEHCGLSAGVLGNSLLDWVYLSRCGTSCFADFCVVLSDDVIMLLGCRLVLYFVCL